MDAISKDAHELFKELGNESLSKSETRNKIHELKVRLDKLGLLIPYQKS